MCRLFVEFKSLKQVKLTQGADEIYATSHALLGEGGCIYEVNPLGMMVVDGTDYLTHEIYFTGKEARVVSCLGEEMD